MAPLAVFTVSSTALAVGDATKQTGPASLSQAMPLPSEILQPIFSDESIGRRDIGTIRLTNHRMKNAVDAMVLPQFRLPTSAVTQPNVTRPLTVSAYLENKAEAMSRTMTSRYTRIDLSVGQHDFSFVYRSEYFFA